jgi:hypothetical protein
MPVLGCRFSDTLVTPRSKLIACRIWSSIETSSMETVSCVLFGAVIVAITYTIILI